MRFSWVNPTANPLGRLLASLLPVRKEKTQLNIGGSCAANRDNPALLESYRALGVSSCCYSCTFECYVSANQSKVQYACSYIGGICEGSLA